MENNNFQLDAVMWHQRSGTAMGKSFAPPYACLTMGYLEETILFPKLLPRYVSTDIVVLIIEFFLRFIDDGIMVLPVEVQAEYFLKILNMMHPAIKYRFKFTILHDGWNHVYAYELSLYKGSC